MRARLLDAPAQEGVRIVALGHLDRARAAGRRVAEGADAEALHDLRAALRRLRAWLRAYDDLIADEVGPKHRRRVGRLAERTGPARDAEVQLAWIERLVDDADPPAVARLRADLRRDHRDASAPVRADVERRLTKIDARLRPRLLHYTCSVRVGEPIAGPRFAEISRSAIVAQRAELFRALEQIEPAGDPEPAHVARIAGERLRYLIEPWKRELDAAGAPLGRLEALQRLLGDLDDLHDLAITVARALDAAEPSAGDGAALLALLARVRTERSATFERLASAWLVASGEREALGRELDVLVDRLAHPPDVEIERKYLLRGLPPICGAHEPVAIDQGYLPGERLIERVRRTRSPSGETYVRTVKLGRGVARIEVEERCSREVFAQLWPLTEGKRVVKRRYAIPAGDRVWEIDAFDDRDLHLAEVELPSEDAEVVFPDWLAPYVEREVTSEDAYTNVNLAR